MVAAPLAMAKVTIYMCGDSTMQDWAEGYYPKQGQGQDFHYWFDVNQAVVVNRGQGGMSLGGGGKDKQGGTAPQDLPNPGTELSALQADSLLSEPPRKGTLSIT